MENNLLIAGRTSIGFLVSSVSVCASFGSIFGPVCTPLSTQTAPDPGPACRKHVHIATMYDRAGGVVVPLEVLKLAAATRGGA